MNEKILVVDDEESIRYSFDVFLSDESYKVMCAGSYREAVTLLKEDNFDLIYADIVMDNGTGLDLLHTVRETCPEVPVIIITGMPSVETAVEALRKGALDYIVKPILQDNLVRSARMALNHKMKFNTEEKHRLNLEAAFHSVKDGMVTLDANMDVVEINNAACAICGFDRGNTMGKKFRPPTGRCTAKCIDFLKEVFAKRKDLGPRYIECLSGKREYQVVSLAAAPMTSRTAEFAGAVLMIRDQTPPACIKRVPKGDNSIVGESECIQKVNELIDELADVSTTVLVCGETGTGKELVVEELHRRGARSRKPLIKINCAALSENLLESELFGHVAGAFTGALKQRMGWFQRADGGTLFLDEIGEISERIQLRLLRFLETMEFHRVGDTATIKVDVRVVTATNQDLEQKVAQKQFRRDLYYRLKIMEIDLQPIRTRPEDIPPLIEHFLVIFNKKFKKNICSITSDVMKLFKAHQWPGNVRELRNTIEHAFVRCRSDVIGVNHLPAEWMNFQRGRLTRGTAPQSQEDEAKLILQTLDQVRWNKSKAAELLGLSRRTIYRKIRKHSI